MLGLSYADFIDQEHSPFREDPHSLLTNGALTPTPYAFALCKGYVPPALVTLSKLRWSMLMSSIYALSYFGLDGYEKLIEGVVHKANQGNMSELIDSSASGLVLYPRMSYIWANVRLNVLKKWEKHRRGMTEDFLRILYLTTQFVTNPIRQARLISFPTTPPEYLKRLDERRSFLAPKDFYCYCRICKEDSSYFQREFHGCTTLVCSKGCKFGYHASCFQRFTDLSSFPTLNQFVDDKLPCFSPECEGLVALVEVYSYEEHVGAQIRRYRGQMIE